ncbi:MAG: hypothetical protein L6R40_004268 [Gallowayella cf. fulva]|nr:MAG: hypothetical protein L6R40_004268 [Xanthomendoza cf. fulva]
MTIQATVPTLNHSSGNITSPPTRPNADVRLIHYTVPDTNIDIDFLLFLHDPIDHDALRIALRHGLSWLTTRIHSRGDDWLSMEDDPFRSIVPSECSIQDAEWKE